jgi:hypothetical protein
VQFRRPEHPVRVAVVAVAALIVVNVAIWGARAQVDGPTSGPRPDEVLDVIPAEYDHVIPQNPVGYRLKSDFVGQLILNDRLIPDDQIEGDPGLNISTFEPGPGKEFRELPKGANHATVQYWARTIGSFEEAKKQQRLGIYSWTFNVG